MEPEKILTKQTPPYLKDEQNRTEPEFGEQQKGQSLMEWLKQFPKGSTLRVLDLDEQK